MSANGKVLVLKGENIARVLDVGTLESGAPYIAMEYLDGEDLGELVERLGPLSAERAAGYVLQACCGIAEAHRKGIIHRDLKPPNLFLTRTPDGRPLIKILDFGISKAGEDDFVKTKTGAVMGSPAFMSPESLEATYFPW